MAIVVTCSACGQKSSAPDSLAGKRAKCTKCGTVVTVPTPAPVAPVAEIRPLVDDDDPLGIGPLPPTQTPAAFLRPASYSQSSGAGSMAGATQGFLRSPAAKLLTKAAFGGLGLLLLLVVVIPVVVRGVKSAASSVAANASYQTLEVASVPVPNFPDLGPGRTIAGGATVHVVDTRSVSNDRQQPGMAMRMRVYLPPGEAAPQSLPCVLVSPAGTPLLWGNNLDDDNYHDETLPYVNAGMAVIFYSLDGPGPANPESVVEARRAYQQFVAARGGVLNGRNAVEFALQKLPQVDPRRIYSAGHSSAANVSLLLAAHEPRIAACVAYAPCTDVPLRLKDLTSDWSARSAFPGVTDFVQKTSPRSYVKQFRCPVFVFHARDDSNEPFSTSERFASEMQQAGANITFAAVNSGDHYQSMVDQGIPQAIEWLKRLPPPSPQP